MGPLSLALWRLPPQRAWAGWVLTQWWRWPYSCFAWDSQLYSHCARVIISRAPSLSKVSSLGGKLYGHLDNALHKHSSSSHLVDRSKRSHAGFGLRSNIPLTSLLKKKPIMGENSSRSLGFYVFFSFLKLLTATILDNSIRQHVLLVLLLCT